MVRKHQVVTVGDAIKEFLSQYKHSGKLHEAEAVNSWAKVMGTNIAALTQSVHIKGSKLIVQLKSSVLRSELMMHKGKIISALNKHLGNDFIKDLILR
jgi:hypothetical protein